MLDIEKELAFCVQKIRENIPKFEGGYPSASSAGLRYAKTENDDWTNSFWTGLLWLCYQTTGDEAVRELAQNYTADFRRRLEAERNLNHHDIGFLYALSCVADAALTGSSFARETALLAADKLLGRFCEKGGFIQAWGNVGARDSYRLIVDGLLNLPLLFWASGQTGDPRYAAAARTHLYTTLRYAMRPDGSAYHTFYFDPGDGRPLRGVTHQGYSDDSAWSRGQAWVICGTALARRYVEDDGILEVFRRAADYFLAHLPDDHVCYWDLIFTDGPEERDTSAAAIAACGMLEASQYTGCEGYREKALQILESLAGSYTSRAARADGILLHGVYAKPLGGRDGTDECMIWGDYYYMEALARLAGGLCGE